MHYVAYLDEFGHIGPFVSLQDPRYNTSPVFGLGGLILPVDQVREFAVYFYQLKCKLLAWELASLEHNPKKLPPYQWEKKGSALYTVRNITNYQELRRATFRLLNHLEKIGGQVFYAGSLKPAAQGKQCTAELYRQTLLQAVNRIDTFCLSKQATFVLVLDHLDGGKDGEWREKNVEACTLSMFESDKKTRSLIEPPIQAESHLFQTLQCADWMCGLIGRLQAFYLAKDEFAHWELFDKYFGQRLAKVTTPNSGMF